MSVWPAITENQRLRKENERLRGLLREAVNRLDLAREALRLEEDKCHTLSTRIQKNLDPAPTPPPHLEPKG